jgi:hypothetical protein
MLRHWKINCARFLMLLACLAAAGPVYAGCTSPAGNEADYVYNLNYHTWQFCNGSSWIAYGGAGGGGSGLTFISTQTASSSASLQFTNLPTSYNTLFLNCAGLLTSTTAGIDFLVGEGGGPAWETGAHYTVVGLYSTAGAVHAINVTTASDLTDAGSNTNTSIPASMKMYIDNVGSSSVAKIATVHGSTDNSVPLLISYESYWNADTNPITGLEVVPSTGNLASGTCSLYGMN